MRFAIEYTNTIYHTDAAQSRDRKRFIAMSARLNAFLRKAPADRLKWTTKID